MVCYKDDLHGYLFETLEFELWYGTMVYGGLIRLVVWKRKMNWSSLCFLSGISLQPNKG